MKPGSYQREGSDSYHGMNHPDGKYNLAYGHIFEIIMHKMRILVYIQISCQRDVLFQMNRRRVRMGINSISPKI